MSISGLESASHSAALLHAATKLSLSLSLSLLRVFCFFFPYVVSTLQPVSVSLALSISVLFIVEIRHWDSSWCICPPFKGKAPQKSVERSI